MKTQIQTAIHKAQAKLALVEKSLKAAEDLAAGLKDSVRQAKQRFKDARRSYKQARRNARQANRERKIAREDFEKAAAVLKKLQKKVRPGAKAKAKKKSAPA